jgi:Domain of unknown function (DUF4258)
VEPLLVRIQKLVESNQLRISEHGFDELSEDRISVRDTVQGIKKAVVVEEYPASGRGPAVLVLEYDRDDRPIHVVWGIPLGYETPAVLVTGYRPDPEQWDRDFLRRRT